MTQKIRAYGNWEDQFTDGLSEWFWTEVVGKALVVGIAISIPMAAFGAITAPAGTTRLDHAMETTTAGHSFLWEHAGNAAGSTFRFLSEINENN